MSQTSEHDADHGQVDPGFLAAREHFIVFAKSAPRREPGKCSLDNPPPFEHVEATGANLLPIDNRVLRCPDTTLAAPRMFYHLHLPPERLFDPLDETTFLVRAVYPDQLEPRKAAFEGLQEGFSALVLLDTGLMHQHVEDQTQGVDEQMPLAPFHFLPAVIPAIPPF